MDGSPLSLPPSLPSNEYISLDVVVRFEFENKDERATGVDVFRQWAYLIYGRRWQKETKRVTNDPANESVARVGMHSVDFQDGKRPPRRRLIFHRWLGSGYVGQPTKTSPRRSCFLFSQTRGWNSDHRGTTISSDPSLVG